MSGVVSHQSCSATRYGLNIRQCFMINTMDYNGFFDLLSQMTILLSLITVSMGFLYLFKYGDGTEEE